MRRRQASRPPSNVNPGRTRYAGRTSPLTRPVAVRRPGASVTQEIVAPRSAFVAAAIRSARSRTRTARSRRSRSASASTKSVSKTKGAPYVAVDALRDSPRERGSATAPARVALAQGLCTSAGRFDPVLPKGEGGLRRARLDASRRAAAAYREIPVVRSPSTDEATRAQHAGRPACAQPLDSAGDVVCRAGPTSASEPSRWRTITARGRRARARACRSRIWRPAHLPQQEHRLTANRSPLSSIPVRDVEGTPSVSAPNDFLTRRPSASTNGYATTPRLRGRPQRREHTPEPGTGRRATMARWKARAPPRPLGIGPAPGGAGHAACSSSISSSCSPSTQCTTIMAETSTSGWLGLLVLGVLWWSWVGYSWLTSVVIPKKVQCASRCSPRWRRCSRRARGPWCVRRRRPVVRRGVRHRPSRANRPLRAGELDPPFRRRPAGLQHRTGVRLVTAAAFTDGLGQGRSSVRAPARHGRPVPHRLGGWKLAPRHFAERHGADRDHRPRRIDQWSWAWAPRLASTCVVTAATLGIALSACPGGCTSTSSRNRRARAWSRQKGREQNEIARTYSYLHFPMVAGIVLVAA